MANETIGQLPTAQALTGLELVPVVQNGVTVQTTTGNIANSPVLNQTFLTVGAQPSLANSRYVGVGAGLSTVDSGAAGQFSINLSGAPLSLVTSPTGFQVKTASNTLASRSITVGSGLGITNADGIAGNPLIAYTGLMSNLSALSGTGLVAISGTLASPVTIVGVSGQTTVANGNGIGSPTIGLDSNIVVPGNGAMTVPVGNLAQRPAGVIGQIRYDTDMATFEGYAASGWNTFSISSGVTLVNTGTGLTGGPITSSGTISIDSTVVTLTGSQILTNKSISGSANTLTSIANSSLTNSAITIGTTAISLGATATVISGLTLSGAKINNSAPYLDYSASTPPSYIEGRSWYDSTTHSLAFYNEVANNVIYTGQQVQLRVINNTGVSIAGGAPVYATATTSGQTYPNIALAQANTVTTSAIIGLTSQSIANGAIGYVTTVGIVTPVNTVLFTVGDTLYLSPYSAGQMMNTVPPTGYAVKVGTVAYVNSTTGQIFVRQSNAYVLAPNISGVVAIINGGTNSTATPTAGGAGYGTGTAHAYTAAGTAGQVLTSTGATAPVWSGVSGGTF